MYASTRIAVPTAVIPRSGGKGEDVVVADEDAAAVANGAGMVWLITIDAAFSAYTKTSLDTEDFEGYTLR